MNRTEECAPTHIVFNNNLAKIVTKLSSLRSVCCQQSLFIVLQGGPKSKPLPNYKKSY